MWLQDTAGEVGVPYHLIKSGRARGDVLVLTKLKGKGKDIPSRFRPESKELPRIGKLVQGDSNCFPMYFRNNLWLSTFLPLPQRCRYKGKQCRGKKIPFISRETAKLAQEGAGGLPVAPRVLPPKASLKTGSLPGSGDDPKGRQQIPDIPCPYTQGPSGTPTFSTCGWRGP